MGFFDGAADLLFRIKADSSQARDEFRGFSAALDKEIKSLQSSATSSLGSLGRLTAAAGPLGVAVGVVAGGTISAAGAIFELTKNAANAGAEIYDLSQRVNFNATTLSGLKLLAEDSNVSFRTLSVGLGLFDKNLEKAAEDSKSKLGKAFKELNVYTSNNEKALRGVFEALYKLGPGAQQTAASMLLFGKSGKDVLEIVKESNGNLDAAIKKYGDLGLIIDSQAAAKAKDFQRVLTLVNQQIAGITRELGEDFMPTVQRVLEATSDYLKDNQRAFRAWGDEASDAIIGIMHLFDGPFGSAVGRGVSAVIDAIMPLLPVLGFIEARLAEIGRNSQQPTDFSPYVSSPETKEKMVRSVLSGETSFSPYVTSPELQEELKITAIRPPKTDYRSDFNFMGGGKGKKGKSGASEEDAETRAHIKELEIQQKAQERIYHETTDAIEREYKLRALALSDYVAQEKAAQAALYKAQIATIDAEIAAAEKLHKSRDRDVKLAELNEKRAAAVSANAKEIQKIDDKAGEEQIATLRKREETLYNIRAGLDNQHIAQFKDYAARRVISEEVAEKQIGRIELTALDLKKGRIQDDLALMSEQSEAYKQRKTDLALLEVQRAGLEQEIERRTFEARRRDVANYRQYVNELTALREQNTRDSLETLQLGIDLMRSHFESRKEINRLQLNHDVAAENARHQEAVNGILQRQIENFDSGKTQKEKKQNRAGAKRS